MTDKYFYNAITLQRYYWYNVTDMQTKRFSNLYSYYSNGSTA
jgi:hypothetical protein